jgi:hypothetical protein
MPLRVNGGTHGRSFGSRQATRITVHPPIDTNFVAAQGRFNAAVCLKINDFT